jgi:hypothetical protein
MNGDTTWDTHDVTDKVHEILAGVEYPDPQHHFGRPFLTAYQLAIEFAERFPDTFRQIGLPVGGRGVGQRSTLAQYLARGLSGKIQNGEITDIEGGFLSNDHLNDILFDHGGEQISSSLTDTPFGVSLFRLAN